MQCMQLASEHLKKPRLLDVSCSPYTVQFAHLNCNASEILAPLKGCKYPWWPPLLHLISILYAL